jgi:hypothetical protein
VRSQDGSRLARRIGAKKSAEYENAGRAAVAPKVAWSDPDESLVTKAVTRDSTMPKSLQLAALPDPPLLPEDAAITAASPAPTASAHDPIPPALEAPSQPTASNTDPTPAAEAASSNEPTNDLARIRRLINASQNHLRSLENYQSHMTRQERVGATLLPVEEVTLSVRRQPFAVRLEWPNGSNKGREALFSSVETQGKLQVRTPGSLMPTISLDPSSPLVLRNSRHPITEAGLDHLVTTLDRRLVLLEQGRGDGSQMRYEGAVQVEELGRACHQIVEIRPNGETWLIGLDIESFLPTVVRAQSADGSLLELYLFRDTRENLAELTTGNAFSPQARWGGDSNGILGRIGRSTSGDVSRQ